MDELPPIVTKAYDMLRWLIGHGGQTSTTLSRSLIISCLQALRCPVVDSIVYGIV
jgi:hypothetical protein